MDVSQQIVTKRREVLRAIARHGGRSTRLFGSVARGQSGPDSDVDLLIDLEPGRTLLDQAALRLELEELLQCTVDVVTERGLRQSIRARVLSEAIPL